MASEKQAASDEREALLQRAWAAYRAIDPPPHSEVFPRGVRKFRSIEDMSNDKDQRIIDWFLRHERKS